MNKNIDFKRFQQYAMSKNGMSTISQVMTIILVFFLYILSDYVSLDGSLKFMTEPMYYVVVTVNVVAIISLMITIRNMRKNDLILHNDNILESITAINRARKVIISNRYSDDLQVYLDELNKENKYQTYLNKISKKINKVQFNIFLTQKKKDKKIIELEQKLATPKEDVLKMVVKYRKVTIAGLFAGIDGKIAITNRFDTDTHNTRDVLQMTSQKALSIYLLSAISGSIIAGLIWQGWAGIWGTIIKLFALCLSCSQAIKQANDFVAYNVEQALDNRVQMTLDYVNSNEEVKNKFLALKKIEEEKTKIVDKKEDKSV